MDQVGFIPVRIGSKRLPEKNLLRLGRDILIGLAVRRLREGGCDPVYVAHDDDRFVPSIAGAGGVPYRRSPETATDDASPIAAFRDLYEQGNIPPEAKAIYTQVTNPFVTSEDVRQAASLISPCVYIVGVARVSQWLYIADGPMYNRNDRNNTPEYCEWFGVENGSLYGAIASDLYTNGSHPQNHACKPLFMPAYTALDIDTMSDWIQVTSLWHTFGADPDKIRAALNGDPTECPA